MPGPVLGPEETDEQDFCSLPHFLCLSSNSSGETVTEQSTLSITSKNVRLLLRLCVL